MITGLRYIFTYKSLLDKTGLRFIYIQRLVQAKPVYCTHAGSVQTKPAYGTYEESSLGKASLGYNMQGLVKTKTS